MSDAFVRSARPRPSGRTARRLASLAFAARRRLARVRSHRAHVGRFEIPMLVGGPLSEAPPLVLLHGFSDTKDSFVDVAREFTDTRRVILPDLPGFSEASQPLDHRYTIPSIAALLMEALAELAPGGVHLVGNSLGGAIVAFMAAERPGWVRSLTLVSAAGVPMPVPSAMQRHIEAGHNPFVLRDASEYPGFLRFVLERMPPLPGPVMEAMAHQFVARRAMNEKILDELVGDDLDLTEQLSRIDVPTMVLWGDRDRLMDLSVARVYHREIRHSRLVILSGIGHAPQVEAPRATARRVRETIERGERGA